VGSVEPNSSSLGKIALEEHFVLAETIESSYAVRDLHPETRQRILDPGSGRMADMDPGGLDIRILSLTAPGVQAIPDFKEAIAEAVRWALSRPAPISMPYFKTCCHGSGPCAGGRRGFRLRETP
jgi:hypothetical protein